MRRQPDTPFPGGNPPEENLKKSIYSPEFETPSGEGVPDSAEKEVLKTGTTTVGLKSKDGVLLATDMRASLGNMVSSKTVQKVEQIHPTAALTIAGSVSPAQALIRHLQTEVSLYETRRGEQMSMRALSTVTSNFLRSGGFFVVSPLLGGVDDEGAHVYSIDPLGGVTEEDYAFSGSGSQMAVGVLEQRYDDELSLDECEEVALEAIDSASERDVNSGNGINVARVTQDGVTITKYHDIDDLGV